MKNKFCKTNINLKVLKLNKTKFISKSLRHKIEILLLKFCGDNLMWFFTAINFSMNLPASYKRGHLILQLI